MDPSIEIRLARELLAGNPEAFDRFVEIFRSKIFHYSMMMCGQRDDAEEVAQETLMKVFESFDQLREPERIRSWVFRIAKNACLMKRRRSIFAPDHELSLDELVQPKDGGSLQIADHADLPETEAFHSEMRGALRQAIGELPEIYRSVVLLRDIEELSTEETAEILDVGVDVVKTRLHRARLALKHKLERHLRVPALKN